MRESSIIAQGWLTQDGKRKNDSKLVIIEQRYSINVIYINFALFRNPAYVDEVGQEYIWPEYDFLGETYLDLKYPMDANSTRTRLLPTMTNFYATFLPMYRGPGSKDN